MKGKPTATHWMVVGLCPLGETYFVGGQRLPIALRLRLALLGRFRIRAVAQSASPFQGSLLGRLSITNDAGRS